MEAYKIEQLKKMLEWELKADEKEQYGAHVVHWAGTAKPINIDAKAIRAALDPS